MSNIINDNEMINIIVNQTIYEINQSTQYNQSTQSNQYERNVILIPKEELNNYIDNDMYYYSSSGPKTYLVGNYAIISEETLFVLYYLSKDYEKAKEILINNDFNINFVICEMEEDIIMYNCGDYYVSEEERKAVNEKFGKYKCSTIFSMFLQEKDFAFLDIIVNHPTFDPTFADNTGVSAISFIINIQLQRSITNNLRSYVATTINQFRNECQQDSNILYEFDPTIERPN